MNGWELLGMALLAVTITAIVVAGIELFTRRP